MHTWPSMQCERQPPCLSPSLALLLLLSSAYVPHDPRVVFFWAHVPFVFLYTAVTVHWALTFPLPHNHITTPPPVVSMSLHSHIRCRLCVVQVARCHVHVFLYCHYAMFPHLRLSLHCHISKSISMLLLCHAFTVPHHSFPLIFNFIDTSCYLHLPLFPIINFYILSYGIKQTVFATGQLHNHPGQDCRIVIKFCKLQRL